VTGTAIIIRQYYVDVAYRYRWREQQGPSVAIVSPAKMAEPIETSFGMWTQMGPSPKEQCIKHWSRSPMQKGNFEGEGRGGLIPSASHP